MMPDQADQSGAAEGQAEVVRFLTDPATHDGADVTVYRTHGSWVFAAGDRVLKMKRAVTFSYLDYGSLYQRHYFCEEEVRINRRTAPEIYLGVLAVTRRADGGLELGGEGEPVEWLVRMRRFHDADLLDQICERDGLSPELCRAVADRILAFHLSAPVVLDRDPAAELAEVSRTSIAEMRRHGADFFDPGRVARLQAVWAGAQTRLSVLMRERGADDPVSGRRVRHAHGDLHLRNIVMWQGVPTPFDAIEFDPAIAEIDVLYDLAFLLMDLLFRGRSAAANRILNRYLGCSGDYAGLPLLPLFLSDRAGIRAHTTASAAAAAGDEEAAPLRACAGDYLRLALRAMQPARPRVVAIGGVSGTGKSTAAAGLAAETDGNGGIGAIVLRSDVIRKRLNGVAPETRLPAEAYRPEMSGKVFAQLAADLDRCLDAGQPVILDAVFGSPANLAPVQDVLSKHGLTLDGIWLTADAELLRQRVRDRRDDASDAGPEVLEAQLDRLDAPADWRVVDAGGSPERTLANIRAALR